MGVPVLPNKGQWGNDVDGTQLGPTSSMSHIWACILGALQQLVGLGGGGGGSGGNVTVAGPLGAQTSASSVATVISGATANGNTTSTTTVVNAGATIAAGALSIEFILYPAFVGTINGATFDNTSANVTGVYRLDAPPWKPLSALVYAISSGSAVLTVQA